MANIRTPTSAVSWFWRETYPADDLAERVGSKRTLAFVIPRENQTDVGALAARYIAPGTTISADESDAYNLLHGRYPMRRVNHQRARCNLPALLIEDGGLDEAQGLLTGLAQRPRLHIQEVFALDGVLAMLNRARGEDEAAGALIANLERLTETELDARMLALARRRVELTTPQGRFEKILKTLLNSPPRPYRPKRR